MPRDEHPVRDGPSATPGDSDAACNPDIGRVVRDRRTQQVDLAAQNRELREMQQTLEEARSRYAELYDVAPVGYLTLDPAGMIRNLNITAAGLLGAERRRLLNQPLATYLAAEAGSALFRHLRETFASGRPTVGLLRLGPDASGCSRVLRADSRLFAEGAGRRQCLTTLIDVSEQEQAEQALRRSERRFRALTEKTSELIHMLDAEGNILARLGAQSSPLGYEPKDLVGRNALALMHPDDLPRVRELLKRLLGRPGGSERSELRVRAKDGSWHWLSGTATNLLDEPEVGALVLNSHDVSKRKQAEAALQASERRMRLALEGARMDVFEYDLAGNRVRFTGTLWPTLGLAARMTGSEFFERVHPDDRAPLRAGIAATTPGQPAYTCDYRTRALDGSWRWISGHGEMQFTAEGLATRLSGICIDLTERKQAELQLRERARRKNEFLATLAHELRNPLAPIRTAVELLRLNPSLDPAAQSARSLIERQVTALVRLVDDLLDVSRITRGKLKLQRKPVTLETIVQQAVESVMPQIDDAGHDFVLDLPQEPVHLDADRERLAQVFLNLLSNASKFTPPGGRIGLAARREGSEVVVTVTDNGIGIKAGWLPLVFDPFAQAQPASIRREAGLGIGLSLVRDLVELHGGSVEAASDGLGKGSTFRVRLPTSAAAADVAAPPAARGAAGSTTSRQILVVDDNVDAAESLAMLLRTMGHMVNVAHDGAGALEVARRDHPRVVLLDLGMPGLDGFDTCRLLRAEPWAAGLVILALTGWAQEDDLDRTRAAGFDGHLTKPVAPDALLQRIEQAVGPGTREPGDGVDAEAVR